MKHGAFGIFWRLEMFFFLKYVFLLIGQLVYLSFVLLMAGVFNLLFFYGIFFWLVKFGAMALVLKKIWCC